jgi:hypothetical protein
VVGFDGSSARSKKARLLSLDAVAPTGDFASSRANDTDFQRGFMLGASSRISSMR